MEDNIVYKANTTTTKIVNFRQERDSSNNKFNNFKTLMYILLLCFMNVLPVRGWSKEIEVNATVCDSSQRTGKYYIDEPRKCLITSPDKIEICETIVFHQY